MDPIISYLLLYNQYLLKVISQLLLFIAKYIPIKQMVFDDSHSPEYQKFKVDKLPKIFIHEQIDYQLLLAYYKHKYGKTVKPIKRKSESYTIPESIVCPRCGAPHQYLYKTTALKVNMNVRFVVSYLMKLIVTINQLLFAALIVVTFLSARKIVSTFAYINALIPIVLTTSAILPSYLKI